MPYIEYLKAFLICSPLIGLLLFLFCSRSRPSKKYLVPRNKFYILRQDYNFPDHIYLERSDNNQSHNLFIEADNTLFKIDEFVPGNIEMALMTVEVYLREIYGSILVDVTFPKTKYDWKDELQIHFKKNTTNTCY